MLFILFDVYSGDTPCKVSAKLRKVECNTKQIDLFLLPGLRNFLHYCELKTKNYGFISLIQDYGFISLMQDYGFI